jgi:hypothetical protein
MSHDRLLSHQAAIRQLVLFSIGNISRYCFFALHKIHKEIYAAGRDL